MEKKLSAPPEREPRFHWHAAGWPACAAWRYGCLAGVAVLLWSGCSRGPAPPPLPKVSPRQAGKTAVTLYDADNDGQLKGDEIWDTPVLRMGYMQFDTNRDGAITANEIAARVKKWRSGSARVIQASPTIFLGTEPLPGATVTLDPAPYLGPNYPSATAVTDSKGRARFTGQDRRYPGVYVGMYAVRVSKIENGRETIPAKYNTQSQLAFEVSGEGMLNSVFSWFYLDEE